MRDPSFVCPGCGKSQIDVLYSDPCQYYCRVCKRALIDENDERRGGIPVLTKAEGESKYPGMCGLASCEKCRHGLHEGVCKETCRWCIPPPPHVYKFRLAR